MRETVVCRYCEEVFVLQLNKQGYRDECPTCRDERALIAAKPQNTRMRQHFEASGLTAEQVKKSIERFRRNAGKLFRAWGWSEEKIQDTLTELEDSPTLGKH